MRQIIRIEHPSNGQGMFRQGDYPEYDIRDLPELQDLKDRHAQFPVPWRDEELGYHIEMEVEYCAFKSIEQIQEWIRPWEFQILINMGFNIYLLEVSQYRESKYQVLYEKEHILSSTIINDLFK